MDLLDEFDDMCSLEMPHYQMRRWVRERRRDQEERESHAIEEVAEAVLVAELTDVLSQATTQLRQTIDEGVTT